MKRKWIETLRVLMEGNLENRSTLRTVNKVVKHSYMWKIVLITNIHCNGWTFTFFSMECWIRSRSNAQTNIQGGLPEIGLSSLILKLGTN